MLLGEKSWFIFKINMWRVSGFTKMRVYFKVVCVRGRYPPFVCIVMNFIVAFDFTFLVLFVRARHRV